MIRNITKCFMVIALVAFLAGSAYAQTKRVLLEQYTGAWCGWCVDGTVVMDKLIEANPETLIGVKLHNGDAMEIAVGNAVMSGLGVGGFPSGSVDRAAFNVGDEVQIAIGRGSWEQAVNYMLQQAPKAEVVTSYDYNESTRSLTVKVDVEFLANVDAETRLNVYLCEDDVTGTGSGYDQKNYLSNRAGFEDNPYYNEPSTITGYHHMKVVRDILGGAFGAEGSVSGNATAGSKYSYTFQTTVDANWNWDNMFIVGTVAEYSQSSRLILNSSYAVKNTPTLEYSSTGESLFVKNSGEKAENTITIKNVSNKSYNITAETAKVDGTPAGWTVELMGDAQFSLAAGESKDITYSLTPTDEYGLGAASIEFNVTNDAEAMGGSFQFAILSNEFEKFEVVAGSTAEAFYPVLQSQGHTEYYPVTNAIMSMALDKLTNVKYILWNCGEGGEVSAVEGGLLRTAMANGVNVMISGQLAPYFISANYPALFSYTGGEFEAVCFQGYNNSPIAYVGIDGDPISDGFDQDIALKDYLSMAIRPTSQFSYTVLKHRTVDTVCAYRTEIPDGARIIMMGINLETIANVAVRNDLLDKAVQWLEGEQVAVGPKMALSVEEINLGEIYLNETEESSFEISNPGDETLNVSAVSFTQDYGAYEFIDLPTFPLTIEAGGSYTIDFSFTPDTEQEYNTTIEVENTNAAETMKSIDVMANGIVNSVDDNGVYGNKSIFTMQVGPNPFADHSTVTYSLNGVSSQFVSMNLVDAAGNIVLNIVNSTVTPGQHTAQITSDNLASGTYFVVVNVNGYSEQMPVVIVK